MNRLDPWLAILWIACLGLGLTVAALFLPQDWTVLRRLAAGLLIGAGSGLILSVNRLLLG